MQRLRSALLALLLFSPPAFDLYARQPEPEAIPGEPLDAAAISPGVIETMAEIVARQQQFGPATPAEGRQDRQGRWVIPPLGATSNPYSGAHCLVNEWGDTRMGIGFPRTVDVAGAYVWGQAARGAWTRGIRVTGYLGEDLIRTTDWFEQIGENPTWFEMDLRGVDRIVIEAVPVLDGGGWYALDDLTFTVLPMAGTREEPRKVVLDFEDTNYKQVLTGTDYAGLTWETGTGDFESAAGVPAPQTHLEDEPQVPEAPPATTRGGLGTLPDLEFSFQGPIRGDAGVFSYPPDTCGAIGTDHFVAIVNRNLSIYQKSTGIRLVSVTLNNFFSPYTTSGDPRILFDQHSGRWIAISTNFSGGQRIQLAISQSSDALGAWFKTQFQTDLGTDIGCWPDYPTLGVDQHGIYITAYMVGCGMSAFAIDKAPLVAPTPTVGAITAFRNFPFEGAIQPVHTFGTPSGEYLISRSSSTTLRLRRIMGPLNSPTLFDHGTIAIPSHSTAPDAPALGSSTDLDTVDTRLMNAVYRDGHIWTAHAINVSNRAACRWYQVNPHGTPATLVQVGTVSDSALYYYFPSVMVNRRGEVVMAFTGSKADQYAGTYYTGRTPVDPAGEMAVPVQFHAGAASQNNIDGFGRNRWGDYSLTSLDPDNELKMWTIQEYGHATNIWGTWIARISFGDCNENGVLDELDISAGTSLDCNATDVPDECELGAGDCNANSVPDDCDITSGVALDCNANAIPDSCDIASGAAPDCNANAIPDSCDVAPGGVSPDCNIDGVPDECQLVGNDCNANLVPDECESADFATTITATPVQQVCPDADAVFTVSAPGATAFQWLRNGEILSENNPFSGTQTSELTIAPASAGADLSSYSCRVSFGCVTADSPPATLDVAPTDITVSLVGPPLVSGCAGDTGSQLALQVDVDDPTTAAYQWSRDGVDLVDDARVTGSTALILQIDDASAADSGSYTCRVWNDCIAELDAESATVVVAFVDPQFPTVPQNTCAEVGAAAQFTAVAESPATFLVRWYEGNIQLTDGAKFTGTATSTLTVHNVQLADNGRQFHLRAFTIDPFCAASSAAATLIAQPVGQCPACAGAAGDMDGDGDFDLVDMQRFTACLGADVTFDAACACANVASTDNLVDLTDWQALSALITGPF